MNTRSWLQEQLEASDALRQERDKEIKVSACDKRENRHVFYHGVMFLRVKKILTTFISFGMPGDDE